MSSIPPRRPPGPPPARPPPTEAPVAIKKPPGPPPSVVPIGSIKPPPSNPPPLAVQQKSERPPIESIKRPNPPMSPPMRPPPPTSPDVNAAPKPTTKLPPGQKEGAISMFEEDPTKKPPEQPPIQAARPPPRGPPRAGPPGGPGSPDMKPRPFKPAPPRGAVGIPEGQPLPPSLKPPDETKAPAPSKPPPLTQDGGRAPPKEDPEVELMRRRQNVTAPATQPPLLRVKKPKEEKVIKRREKDMPEFESSDEDEEAPKLVQQPLPFGVLKGEVPALKRAEDEEAEEEKGPRADENQSVSTAQTADVPGKLEKRKSVRLAKPKEVEAAPAAAPSDTRQQSDFVPAAPGLNMDKFFDDSSLGKILTRGRLSIKCIEGIDIRRKDDQDRFPRNDPFLKFRLGVAERLPWKTTETKRKQDANPKFDNEIVFFDIVDPLQYIFQEDVQLCIELWNNSVTRNELIGSVTMSVVRFFKQPFVSYTEKIPIYYTGVSRSSMRLILELVFEEARSGMAQITVFECVGLRNIDPLGQQDPFVQFSLGRHYKKRTKSVKAGGTEPYFNEEEVLLWLDQDNWVEDLKIEVLDEDAKEERPIGTTQFSLLPYMKRLDEVVKEEAYDLFYYILLDPKDDTEKKEVACGQIIMRIKFFQAGRLTVFVDRAKDLQFPENVPVTRFDPYTELTLDGKAVQIIKRTPADKDGGKDPIWQNQILFDVVDQYLMDLKVFNQNITGKDTLLGFAEISLLQVFRNGQSEFWTSLKQKRVNGGIKEVGDIYLKLSFTGPVGIAYPQFRSEVDTFDDTLRKLPEDAPPKPEGDEAIKESISTVPAEDKPMEQQLKELQEYEDKKRAEAVPQEFSDEEIVAAFRFIDLDHNNFVGAAEIRHILVCMGEMITDEEIDMMISMVDLDGDGQVSFKEFRTLVLHPNPAAIDLHKEINQDRESELMKDKQALAGKNQANDLESFQRQKELLQRETKKKFLQPFIVDNEVTFETLKQSFYDFMDLPRDKRIGGKLKFPEFCKVLKIEPITEYKNMHALYDNEETGECDLREFLLSLMNFLPIDKESRVKFSFEMFDETKSGFITQKEIEEILRGNHILSLNSVRRKAETIMRQAHTNESGAITLKEFIIISKKFPNILYPASGITNTKKS